MFFFGVFFGSIGWKRCSSGAGCLLIVCGRERQQVTFLRLTFLPFHLRWFFFFSFFFFFFTSEYHTIYTTKTSASTLPASPALCAKKLSYPTWRTANKRTKANQQTHQHVAKNTDVYEAQPSKHTHTATETENSMTLWYLLTHSHYIGIYYIP